MSPHEIFGFEPSCEPAPGAHLKAWRWHIEGAGLEGGGVLWTTAKPDSAGEYTVEAIAGQVDGVRISELFPAGQSIPQNAGYPVDNLLSRTGAQLDGEGLGFGLANGEFVNLYDYNGYFAVLTNSTTFLSEPAISFSAKPI